MAEAAVASPVVEQFDLNAHEEKPPEQFDLAPQSNSIYSVPEILKDKSEKFAFGVDAPTEDIRKQLETGGEHYLREAYAAQESLNKRQLRNNLLVDIAAQKKGPLTSDDLAEFDSLVNLDTNIDPKTVLEEAYGKKFSNLAFQSAKDVTVHKSTMDTVPDLALDGLDAVGSAVARREVANEVIQNLNLEFQKSADKLTIGNFFGGLAKSVVNPWYNFYEEAGRLPIDFLKTALPAYYNVKLGGWRWSTGDALVEEYQNLSLLSPSEFRTEFEKRVQDLAQENLPLALQWASGYLQYSNSDAGLDNTFGYVDWIGSGALAIGTAAKLKGAVRPGSKLPQVDGSKPPSIHSTPPKAPDDIPQAAPSANVRVEPVTSEEQLEHIKDFRKALADTVKAANAATPEESLAKLGDVDAAAEIATHKRLVAEFEGKDPFDDGVSLRDKLQGVFSPHEFADDTGNLTAGKQARIMGHLTRSSNNALRMLNTPSGVVRMTPEQLAEAVKIEKAGLLKTYSNVSDAILDVEHGGPFRVWTPEEQGVNVHTVELRLGEISGKPKDAPVEAPVATPTPKAGPRDGEDGIVLPENATPLDRLAKVAAEDYQSYSFAEFKGELAKESQDISASVNKLRGSYDDVAPWEDFDEVHEELFDPAWSDAKILTYLTNDRNLEAVEDGFPTLKRMLWKLYDGNKGKPVTEAQVQKVLDYAKSEAPAVAKTTPEPPLANGYVRMYRGEGGSEKLGSKPGGGWFTTNRAEAEIYVKNGGEGAQVVYVDIPDNKEGWKHFIDGPHTGNKRKHYQTNNPEILKQVRPLSEGSKTTSPFVSSINKVTTARGDRVLVRDLYDELKRTGEWTKDFGEFRKHLNDLRKAGQIKMSAHTDKLPDQLPEIKRNLSKKGIEEGNWASEFKRDLGHENTTLRNRVIDSEFVVKDRTKYTSPVRMHYVEMVADAPSSSSKPPAPPRIKAIYEPATVDNEEQLLTALVGLQSQIAKTPHSSLYDRITKYVNSIERRLVSNVDPGIDNRKFDTDLLGSPYSTKEFKSSSETVEKRKLPARAQPRPSTGDKWSDSVQAKVDSMPGEGPLPKVMIARVFDEYQAGGGKMSYEQFKSKLLEKNRDQTIRLTTIDDPTGIDIDLKRRSTIKGTSTNEYHAIQKSRAQPQQASQRPSIDLDIASAYRAVRAKNPNESWVTLEDLRSQLSKYSRQDVDAALKRLFLDKDVNLTTWDDQGSLTDAQRAAAMRLGSSRIDRISVSNDSPIFAKPSVSVPKEKGKQPGFTVVGREESPLQLSTKAPDADFVGRDYSGTAAPKPWQKRTSPDQIERFRDLEKQTNEYLAGLAKNKKVPVQVKVGTPQASLFKSRKAAAYYATNVYGVDPKRFRIGQQGNGYYISIPKIVDETYDAVRDLAIVNNRQSEEGVEGFLKAALGYIFTPDEYLSKQTVQNRKVATYGPSEMHRYVEEMAPTLIGLRGKEREELTDILQAHRDYKYEETTPSGRQKIRRGKFSKTLGAFEQEFHARYGKVPSEAQTTAYFEGVILHDADLGMRDLALVRDVGRLGLEKTTIGWHVPDPEVPNATQRRQSRPFAAKPIDKLPLDDPDGEQWGVWVYDPHAKSGNFYLRSELTKDVLDDIDVKTGTHGYKILELGNPLEKPLIQAAGTDELVNFIVVKDYRAQKYDWNNIPRRPGGHIAYQDSNSVSQAIIRKSDRGGKIRHVYEGDTIMLNVTTEAQAKKLAKAIDDARLLLKDNRMDDLKRHLEANTPFDSDQFRAFFKERVDPETGDVLPPKHSLDHPFTYTTGGRNTMDMSHFKDYGRNLENFIDSIRSKYNLFANNVDKKYLGERHPDVPSVFEWRNKDDQPAFTLTAPRLIDPYESINSALANVSRSKYFNDLKIQAAENFIEQFHTVMKAPLDEMRRNPVYYLHNPGWDTTTENFSLLALGFNTRQAHLNLIGSESMLGKGISFAYQKMLNGVYETRGWGQPAADNISNLLRNAKNPVDFVRGTVFYLKLGMFNPVQYWRQGVAVAHVTALTGSPSRARDAWLRAWAARKLALTDDPKMIEGVADLFGERTAKLGNFDPARFKEAYQELRATGFYNVGGEYASRDDLFDPKVAKGRAGAFLDKSTFFFKEGERFPRMMAWFTAYDEWRATNPTKKMMNADRAWVLDRADLLTTNMSRASNANLQQGSASIPTQFWSYPLRLAEQLLGTRLTTGERTRLILSNMALWGVPVGLGAATVIPFYDDIRQALLEQGVDLKDPMVQVLHDGIVSTALSVITGEEYSVGKSYGPGGIQALKKVLSKDSNMLEFLGGAAGSVVGDMIKGSDIGYDYLMSWMDPEHTPPTAADLIDFTKNVSSVSNAIRAYYMYNTGTYLTNNEIEVLGESSGTDYATTGTDAFMQLAFGLSPTGVDNTYAMLKSNKERREAISVAEKEAQKHIKRAIQAEAQGDYTQGDIYRRKAKAALVHVPQDRWAGVLRGAAEDNIPLLERVLQDFIKASPDAETQKLRQERGYEMMGVTE